MNHINGTLALREDYDKFELAITCTGHHPAAAVKACARYADRDEAWYGTDQGVVTLTIDTTAQTFSPS